MTSNVRTVTINTELAREPVTLVGRVAQLDSLRGIAALLVVLHHAPQAFANSVTDATTGLSAYLDVGRLGVISFFMLSGFVIVKAFPGNQPRSIGVFWKHRFFRLFPPFWISVLFATIVALIVGSSACCAFVTPVTMPTFLANLTMIPLRLHQPMLIGVYWSLEQELFFYVLISTLTFARLNGAKAVTAAAFLTFFGAILAAAITTLRIGPREIGKDQLFLALLHLSLMFAGGMIRYHWDTRRLRLGFISTMPLALKLYFVLQSSFFLGVVAVKLRHGLEPHTFRVAATYLLGIGSFLVCLRYFEGSAVGTAIGNRSYGIYLIHVPVMSLLSYAMARLIIPPLGYAAYLTLTLVVTLMLADLLRRGIERPAIRLGHLHDRWLSARRTLVAAAAPNSILEADGVAPTVTVAFASPSDR